MSTYRLFPSSSAGPNAAVSYTKPITLAVQFEVTTGGCWLEGYWFWVSSSSAPTEPQGFALWQAWQDSGEGYLIIGASVTSGTLKAGAWNYVALAQPVPLSVGATYIAATGLTGGFPQTTNQFGANEPYSAGITNGPLFAYSDQGGSAPAPNGLPQGAYSTASADPSKNTPENGNSSANFWVDVQITTTPPSGASYRLWPNYGTIAGQISNDPDAQSFGTEFHLTETCTLDKLWFYSPPTAEQLPTACAIWNVPASTTGTATMILGTDNESPTWSGAAGPAAAGSGWVSVDYTGVTLPAGQYKATVYCSQNVLWYQENTHYFSTPHTSVQTVGVSLTPAGYWMLDSNADDSSPGDNNGTVNGSVSFGQSGPLQGGTSAGFSGAASITTGLNLSGYSALSFAAWVRVASGASGTQTVVGSSSASMQLVDSSGDLAIELTVGGSTATFATSAAWADDSWHLVAVTWDGTNAYGFLDDNTINPTAPVAVSGSISSAAVTIGGDFDGGLAHVIVGNQAWYATPPTDQETYPYSLWYPSQFTTGPGWNGITNGPLSTPDILSAGAVIGNWTNLPMTGNSSYSNPNSEFIYPNLYDVKDGGENRWVDVEVTPVVVTPPPVPAAPSVVLAFFP